MHRAGCRRRPAGPGRRAHPRVQARSRSFAGRLRVSRREGDSVPAAPRSPLEPVRLEELDFPLPPRLIAQHPAEPRDSCRLLHLDLTGNRLSDRRFFELPTLLHSGDVLVVNDSKVLPARVRATKKTGGRVELLFLRAVTPAAGGGGEVWESLARPSNRLKPDTILTLPGGESLRLVQLVDAGRWLVAGPSAPPVLEILDRYGEMPLPPYVKDPLADPSDYQTVYAIAPGSAAAPTAGLHFTEGLLSRLAAAGIDTARVTLHVGLDTFRPINEEIVENHVIHREAFSVRRDALRLLDAARREGRRVVAVGTTSVRVLETLYAESSPGMPASGPRSGSTGVFISPGYRFRAVDALITNFHLPRTSLLALVMAFAGEERVRDAYRHAVAEGYRFFSFGDAMLIDGVQPRGG
jgi:S-adenosylmethionine:tRNA ribosyltransferase-isomerase